MYKINTCKYRYIHTYYSTYPVLLLLLLPTEGTTTTTTTFVLFPSASIYIFYLFCTEHHAQHIDPSFWSVRLNFSRCFVEIRHHAFSFIMDFNPLTTDGGNVNAKMFVQFILVHFIIILVAFFNKA